MTVLGPLLVLLVLTLLGDCGVWLRLHILALFTCTSSRWMVLLFRWIVG